MAASVAQNICKAVPQPSRSGDLIRAIIILSAFAFPIIILRIIARRMVAEIWWDDWAIIGAGVSYARRENFVKLRLTLSDIYDPDVSYGNI